MKSDPFSTPGSNGNGSRSRKNLTSNPGHGSHPMNIVGPEGDKVKHRPIHSYTMKQAIQEKFILDVLEHYTPVASYYRLMKKISDDPEFDTRKAQKKLRRYFESHQHAIRKKAEIMIDHFHGKVLAQRKIGDRVRAMVITSGVELVIRITIET